MSPAQVVAAAAAAVLPVPDAPGKGGPDDRVGMAPSQGPRTDRSRSTA